jgi:dihydrofolate reductase
LRDADGDAVDRRAKNEAGFAQERVAGPPPVLGLQIQTMESWLLADGDAFERVVGVRADLRKPAEQLWGKPRTPSHPKEIYNRAVREGTGRNERDTAIRIAEAADLEVLARACPEGFGRFRGDFERAFKTFDCVVAADLENGIGANNGLPWPRLKTDMKHFRDTTSTAATGKRNAIIMGRKTWESVPEKQRPLPGRWNVVVSRGEVALAGDAAVARSLDEALTRASLADDIDQIFVVGGAQIYTQAFAHVRCRDVVLTRIQGRFESDAHIPDVSERFVRDDLRTRSYNESGFDYSVEYWRRRGRA